MPKTTRRVLLSRYPGGIEVIKDRFTTRGIDVSLTRPDGTVEWLTPRPRLMLRIDQAGQVTIDYQDPRIEIVDVTKPTV